MASYLRGHGWHPGLTDDETRRVVYAYNHSDLYVLGVVTVADRIRDRLAVPVRRVSGGKGKEARVGLAADGGGVADIGIAPGEAFPVARGPGPAARGLLRRQHGQGASRLARMSLS